MFDNSVLRRMFDNSVLRRMFDNSVLRRIFGPKSDNVKDAGENYIMRSSINLYFHQILLR
jgi:hypothetical protein